MKKLCKSHVTALQKVTAKLAYKQTMQSTQLILSVDNRGKMEEAEKLIYKAINLLQNVG